MFSYKPQQLARVQQSSPLGIRLREERVIVDFYY